MNKLSNYLIATVCLFGFANCDMGHQDMTPEQKLILQVSSTDRLYTTEYMVHKMVTYDDIIHMQGSILSQKFDFKLPQGNRKIIIPIEAKIKAYIDFKDFSEDNVSISPDGTHIIVSLPDPKVEITSTKVNHGDIKKFVDFGCSSFNQEEISEYQKQGRAAIVNDIPKLGIIERARTDAYNLLLPMIEGMGYEPENITINFNREFSTDDLINSIVTFKQ